MKQPLSQLQENRKPGRSFDDPSQPLGVDTIARAAEAENATAMHGAADRAKAVAVLRKLEELAADNNPTAFDETSLRRAHELAAGRVGLTFPEYEALVREDFELLALERKVLDAARARFR